MGTPVPEDWPVLVDDKYYCVTEDWFFNMPPGPPYDCSATYRGTSKCCRTGSAIKAWYEGEFECVFGAYLCDQSEGSARITCATGPYDTYEECFGVCK